MRERCLCGCGQPTAATMRMRKLRCDECGCPLRMSRSWLEVNGAPSCGCGGSFEPECLEDRCRLPGDAGEAARVECMGRADEFAVRSERARKAGATRSRRAAARRNVRERAQSAGRDEIPF
jgi:hypothetical protein